jgi:hypothetical protein
MRNHTYYDALRKSSYVNLSQCEVKRQASQCGLFLQGCQILRVEGTMLSGGNSDHDIQTW